MIHRCMPRRVWKPMEIRATCYNALRAIMDRRWYRVGKGRYYCRAKLRYLGELALFYLEKYEEDK